MRADSVPSFRADGCISLCFCLFAAVPSVLRCLLPFLPSASLIRQRFPPHMLLAVPTAFFRPRGVCCTSKQLPAAAVVPAVIFFAKMMSFALLLASATCRFRLLPFLPPDLIIGFARMVCLALLLLLR